MASLACRRSYRSRNPDRVGCKIRSSPSGAEPSTTTLPASLRGWLAERWFADALDEHGGTITHSTFSDNLAQSGDALVSCSSDVCTGRAAAEASGGAILIVEEALTLGDC